MDNHETLLKRKSIEFDILEQKYKHEKKRNKQLLNDNQSLKTQLDELHFKYKREKEIRQSLELKLSNVQPASLSPRTSNTFEESSMINSIQSLVITTEPDSPSDQSLISSRESKIVTFYNYLMELLPVLKDYRNAIDTLVTKSDNLNSILLDQVDSLSTSPDTISSLYCLNGIIGDFEAQLKILSISIDNSLLIPIQEFIAISMPKLKEFKFEMEKQKEELHNCQIRQSNDAIKSENNIFNYKKEYFYKKFDFLEELNKTTLFIDIDFQEKTFMLIYGFLVY